MDFMQSLQSILGQGASGVKENKALGGLGNFFLGKSQAGALGPAAIGGLVGAIFGGKKIVNMGLGALLAGGGVALWNRYKQRMQQEDGRTGAPKYIENIPPAPGDRAARLVRAMVFAAKSDGHIDEGEQRAIQSQLGKLNIGPEAQNLIVRAMSEPLDPNLLAAGVSTPDEALEIFTISCAAVNVDHFMERSYLDALAKALKIPDDVKLDIENKIKNSPDGADM